MSLSVRRVATLQGQIRPPSDKSLTHRAYMLGAIASGPCVVFRPLRSEDTQATLDCLSQMGLKTDWLDPETVELGPPAEWHAPGRDLYCGNSGTTMRLLSGLIASRPIAATLTGDASLMRRPMKRIAEPLRLMGAEVQGDRPPIMISGADLEGIDYHSPVASAQIKSCILLAGLRADGETFVTEPSRSRDHTERMLRATGVAVKTSRVAFDEEEGGLYRAGVAGGSQPFGFKFRVPGDISSAAFFMVAAAIVPQSRVTLLDVGANPTRTGIFEVFDQAGISWFKENERESLGEPLADIEVSGSDVYQPFEISGAMVPRLIDEIPILSVLATQCDGTSVIRNAGELRVKESDRIERITSTLSLMGAEVETFEDGFAVHGPTRLQGAHIDPKGDHRIAMAFAVAGLIADGETVIEDTSSIGTSYPDFEKDLWSVCVV
jgi:3-phosphoshikimate 1-carboxyvinyltransferase